MRVRDLIEFVMDPERLYFKKRFTTQPTEEFASVSSGNVLGIGLVIP